MAPCLVPLPLNRWRVFPRKSFHIMKVLIHISPTSECFCCALVVSNLEFIITLPFDVTFRSKLAFSSVLFRMLPRASGFAMQSLPSDPNTSLIPLWAIALAVMNHKHKQSQDFTKISNTEPVWKWIRREICVTCAENFLWAKHRGVVDVSDETAVISTRNFRLLSKLTN